MGQVTLMLSTCFMTRSVCWAVAVTVHHTSICRSKNFALFIVARMFILLQSKQKKGNNENLLSRVQINSKQTIIFVNETKNLKAMMKTSFSCTTKKCFGLLVFALMGLGIARAQVITFYTPRTVHVVKALDDAYKTESQVVIAPPEKVKVNKQVNGEATTYRTSALTVKVEQGRVAFYDAQGRLLTAEGESTYTPITEGPDKGAYRVGQAFSVEADEAIYGIGLVQNGKLSQRGEPRGLCTHIPEHQGIWHLLGKLFAHTARDPRGGCQWRTGTRE